jgi:hypothetical protein
MASLVLLLLSYLSLPIFSATQQSAPPEKGGSPPFAMGVLRRDGIISPFAAFDGKNWTAPWPMDPRSIDLPIDMNSIPSKWWGKAGSSTEMTAWVNGVNRGPVHLLRPTVLPLMCEPRVGLVSDYQSKEPAPPSFEPPFPKDGLAVSGTQTIDRIEVLSPQSREWKPTASFLSTDFDNAENDAIGAFGGWKHPIARALRRKMPVELEALYRAPMDQEGWTGYYVEAVKKYEPGPDDDGCGLVTSANGWLSVGPDGKTAGRLTAQVTYCDRRDVTYMLPLGLVRADGRSFWVFQLSGYGREGYVVVRPTSKRLESHVKYSAGVCPRHTFGVEATDLESPVNAR